MAKTALGDGADQKSVEPRAKKERVLDSVQRKQSLWSTTGSSPKI